METTPKSRFKKLLKRKLFWFVFIVIILIITGIIYSSLKPVKEELVTSQAIIQQLVKLNQPQKQS